MSHLDFNALYGSFDNDMLPFRVTDVTNIITENFLSEGKITIPSGTNFNKIFGDRAPDKRHFLQLKTVDRKYNIREDNYKLDVEVDLNDVRKHIKLVYYAYIHRNSNWEEVISGQLSQLKSFGILDEADLYVHITDPAIIFYDATAIIKEICNDAIISISYINHFEYHAIKLIYDLAKKDPDTIFMYLHTKGITYDIQSRTIKEIALLAGTFENWRKNLESFHDKKISKMGLFPAVEGLESKIKQGIKGGWIWYNFWYAKGSYLISCEEPVVREDRFYFEDWLGGPQDDELITKNDCHNLSNETNQTYFTGPEASLALKSLAEKIE